MKKLIAVIILSLCASCTQPGKAKRILSEMGYTDIETTGYAFFECSKDDIFHTGFTAISPNGKRVNGTVCSGVLKGATVRW